nr:hypothetical protein [Tanacetum cinerariifolium]
MDMTIDQQVAMDKALVPHASRLRIGKSKFRLRLDITSKETTLQMVYDVLQLTPFYKAFLVTADVPEIYMQELWATATVYHHSIRFKMDNKKRIINLEYFREMMHICPRLPGQTFDDLPFEEEIIAFLRFLGHSGEIRKLVDVNKNKLHQPWRSFATIINKCLSGKSTGYDSLRLSQAQILWGMYHKKNVDFVYLLWEDFVYQVEHKDAKKSNEMTIPVESGAAPPKTKASFRKTKSSYDTTITPSTATATRLSTFEKGKQLAKASKVKSLTMLSEVAMTEAEQMNDEDDDDDQDEGNDDDQDTVDEGDEFIHPKLTIHEEEETKDEESFDPIAKTLENSDDEGNDDANLGLNVGSEEGQDAEDDEDELYRDVNINLEGRDVQMTDVHTTQEFEDTHVTLTPVNPDGQQQSSSVSSQFVTGMLNPSPDTGIGSLFEPTSQMDVPASTTVAFLTLIAPTLTPPTIPTISRVPQAPTPPTTAPCTLLQDLPNFGLLFGFDHRLKTLEANFSEFVQTNQFARAVSSIPGIVQRYMDQQINEAVKIIKEQVKEQVKVQVSKILPKIENTVNEQLEAKVLTRSSNSSKTSHDVVVGMSELELKKILIEKIDIVTLKRRRDDDADKDEEPFARSDRGSKRRREGKEPESTSAPKEKATRTTSKSTQGSKSQQKTASDLSNESTQSRHLTLKLLVGPTYELMKGSCKSLVELEFFLEETEAADYDHIKWIEDLVPRTMWSQEPSTGSLLEMSTLNVESPLLLNFRLSSGTITSIWIGSRMFTRSIVIQRRVEDLQLGVESYQKKLNLTKPDTYHSDLKHKEAYTAYSNPRGFIYQNKDKQNRLMQIDELHKFSDGTLNDVRTALDGHLKGIFDDDFFLMLEQVILK